MLPPLTTNGDLMTELAASAIALMLTIELAVAIACVTAWFWSSSWTRDHPRHSCASGA
jgi:hypothetical protein